MNIFFFRRRRRVAATARDADNSSTHPQDNPTHNRMTDIFVERVSNAADIATIILGSLAAVAGIIAWLSAKEDATRKDAALEKYKDESRALVSEATKVAALANEGQAKANEAASKANERAAILEKEAALANERSKTLEMDLHKIRKIQHPRRVSPDQAERFHAFMKDAPRGRVCIIPQLQTEEPLTLSRDLFNLLRDSGFAVREELGITTLGAPSGVRMLLAKPQAPPQHAVPLQQGLKFIGIEALGYGGASDDEIIIQIGEKTPE